MKQFLFFRILIFLSCFLPLSVMAQLPVCSGPGSNIVYSLNAPYIHNYDPILGVSTINSITGASGAALAVSNNLNAASPSPTFYIAVGGTYRYYDGTSWVNTGHTSGSANIGAGGGYIYALLPPGYIYQYNGTGNAQLLTTLSVNAAVFDIVADCAGNFYVLNLDTGSLAWFRKYSPSGTQLHSWTVSGAPSAGGGGLGMIGDSVYLNCISTFSGLYKGILSGSSLNFSLVDSNFIASDLATCQRDLSLVYANVDSAHYCPGGTADTLYSMGADTVSWAVINGPAIISGSGDTITVTATANSRIVLSSNISACPAHTDTINLIVPPLATITTNSPLCTGDSLYLHTNGISGTTYNWHGPNNFSDSIQNTSRTNIILADSGYYAVTETEGSCTSSDSVFIHIHQRPATPIANSNSPVCAGDSLVFTISNPQSGVGYTWTGPGTYNNTNQNPVRLNAQTSYSGIYKVVVNLNGCMDSATTNATVNPVIGAPTIHIAVMPNDTICAGSSAIFTAITGNAGSPVYAWKHNGGSVGTSSNTYTTSSISNGDFIDCEVSSASQCQAVDTALSNVITMHVLAISTPTVNITSQPTMLIPLHTDTFTAHVNNCSTPAYQWYRNGGKISGAITNPYITTLAAGDHISVEVHCGGLCEIPDSVGSNMLTTTGVVSLESSISNIRVYPNPIQNELIIESSGNGMQIKIYNTIGQEVFLKDIKQEKEVINTSYLISGIYILQFIDVLGNRMNKILIKQ